jgi:hypothetical protein
MAEQRCEHGFLCSVVPCPHGCGGGPVEVLEEDRSHNITRAIPDAVIAETVERVGTLGGAARQLGVSVDTIRNRAKKSPAVKSALAGRPRHPGFVDLTGKVFGSWTVVREAAPSRNGNTRWLCRHDCEFGGELIMEGIRLRDKPRKFCDDCRAGGMKRAG